MAEERFNTDEQFSHDDMTVLRVLMHEVRGLNAISVAPALLTADERDELELNFEPVA